MEKIIKFLLDEEDTRLWAMLIKVIIFSIGLYSWVLLMYAFGG